MFFTTICTVALSAMAIAVSVNANKIAQRQSSMDYQDRLAEFEIIKNTLVNKDTKKWEASTIQIYKTSGKAKNTDIEIITWLEVDYSNDDGSKRSSRFMLDGYYNNTFFSTEHSGPVATISGGMNQAKEFALEDYIEEVARFRHAYVNLQVKSFLKIKYLDFENNERVNYYDVSSSSGRYITSDTLSKYFDPKVNPIDKKHRVDLQNNQSPSGILPLME